jgi:hypothetical protein
MDLYFSPLACSMATRIALYEAGADANYLEVDPKTKRVQSDGSDFFKVNPLGLVPTLPTASSSPRTRQYCSTSPSGFLIQASAQNPAWIAAGCSNGCASSAPNCTRACSCRCFPGRHLPK